ncbi:DUF3325 family protein [Leeuwenhoekiella marinoflava]|uniref:DUF3325 family protein n=1 Tax=Leeuwenhoekiella marinoflava TaxID=988 RepID=UPI0030017E5C
MITIASSLALLGFYMVYSTSKRAKLALEYKLQKWAKENEHIGKFLGIGLLLISLICSITALGIGAGVFSFLVIVMTSGSLVVLLSPLRFFNLPILMISIVLCFGIEIILFLK